MDEVDLRRSIGLIVTYDDGSVKRRRPWFKGSMGSTLTDLSGDVVSAECTHDTEDEFVGHFFWRDEAKSVDDNGDLGTRFQKRRKSPVYVWRMYRSRRL